MAMWLYEAYIGLLYGYPPDSHPPLGKPKPQTLPGVSWRFRKRGVRSGFVFGFRVYVGSWLPFPGCIFQPLCINPKLFSRACKSFNSNAPMTVLPELHYVVITLNPTPQTQAQSGFLKAISPQDTGRQLQDLSYNPGPLTSLTISTPSMAPPWSLLPGPSGNFPLALDPNEALNPEPQSLNPRP